MNKHTAEIIKDLMCLGNRTETSLDEQCRTCRKLDHKHTYDEHMRVADIEFTSEGKCSLREQA